MSRSEVRDPPGSPRIPPDPTLPLLPRLPRRARMAPTSGLSTKYSWMVSSTGLGAPRAMLLIFLVMCFRWRGSESVRSRSILKQMAKARRWEGGCGGSCAPAGLRGRGRRGAGDGTCDPAGTHWEGLSLLSVRLVLPGMELV